MFLVCVMNLSVSLLDSDNSDPADSELSELEDPLLQNNIIVHVCMYVCMFV